MWDNFLKSLPLSHTCMCIYEREIYFIHVFYISERERREKETFFRIPLSLENPDEHSPSSKIWCRCFPIPESYCWDGFPRVVTHSTAWQPQGKETLPSSSFPPTPCLGRAWHRVINKSLWDISEVKIQVLSGPCDSWRLYILLIYFPTHSSREQAKPIWIPEHLK